MFARAAGWIRSSSGSTCVADQCRARVLGFEESTRIGDARARGRRPRVSSRQSGEQRPHDAVLAAGLDPLGVPARHEAVEDRLDLVARGMPGRAQRLGALGVADAPQLRPRSRPRLPTRRPRRRAPRHRTAHRPSDSSPRSPWLTCSARDARSRARRARGEASRVGAARNEAEHVAAGLDQPLRRGCARRYARADPPRKCRTSPRRARRASASSTPSARSSAAALEAVGRGVGDDEPCAGRGRRPSDARRARRRSAASARRRASSASGRASSWRAPVRSVRRARSGSRRRPGACAEGAPRGPVAVGIERAALEGAVARVVELGQDDGRERAPGEGLDAVAACARSSLTTQRSSCSPASAPAERTRLSTAERRSSGTGTARVAVQQPDARCSRSRRGGRRSAVPSVRAGSSGSRRRAPCRSTRRARSRRRSRGARRASRSAFVRSSTGRGRACPRAPKPRPRTSGSTQTCWICTAAGVQAETSALKSTTPSSSHSHERPSMIWACVRQRKPSASGASGSIAELLGVGGGADRDEQLEIVERRGAQPAAARRRRLADRVDGLAGAVVARRRQQRRGRLPELADRRLLADDRAASRSSAAWRSEGRRSHCPDGTTFAPSRQSATSAPLGASSADEAPEARAGRRPRGRPARPGSRAQNSSTCSSARLESAARSRASASPWTPSASDACAPTQAAILLQARSRRSTRLRRRCRSISARSPATTPRRSCSPAIRCGQATSPRPTSTARRRSTASAACSASPAPTGQHASRCRAPAWAARARRSSSRSSIQLGCTRLIRVGTCGGLQIGHALGDLVVALSAVPADATATHLVAGEPHCPTATCRSRTRPSHLARAREEHLHVGPIVSSDLFYNPDGGQYERWASRGVLAVEMEAAALFTVAALRGVSAGCLLTVRTSSSKASSPASPTRSCGRPSTA